MSMQQFCLRWNNHQPNFISVFTNLLNSQSLVDVTLAAEGRHIQAHRVVLSACSSYFQTLFSVNPHQHPIVILKDVKYNDLKIIVNFMYYGEVNVSQEQLPSIIKTAENLKIKGLTDMPENNLLLSKSSSSQSSDKPELLSLESNWNIEGRPISPSSKRKRLRKTSTGSTENTSEEIPNEISLTSSPGLNKHEPMLVTPETESIRSESSLRASGHEQSTESEPREGSQESTDDVPSHLGSQDSTASEGMGPSLHEPSTSHPPSVSTQDRPFPTKGGKRGRLLMRQHRVKKDSDSLQVSPESEPSSPQYGTVNSLLTLSGGRIERQSSEPPPFSQPLSPQMTPGQDSNLLSVPQPSHLYKQLSHPLLPSQQSSNSGLIVQRQLSTPTSPTSSIKVQMVSHSETPVLRVISDSGDSQSSQKPPKIRIRSEELRRTASSPQPLSTQALNNPGHCPVLRPGPALGCNFCWNTVDSHGRILRRKTKYHCLECRSNLCIVPCFQEYHERYVVGGTSSSVQNPVDTPVLSPGGSNSNPVSILKHLPKTSSI